MSKAAESIPRPTEAELELLRILWETEPATVREIYDRLNQERASGYTTVLKLLQIMTAKGLVVRDEANRAHVYRAAMSQDAMQSTHAQGLEHASVLRLGRATGNACAGHGAGQRERTRRNSRIDRTQEIPAIAKGAAMTHTIEATAWTLIHFCWQAALIAGAYRVASIALARRTSQVRYVVALSALLAMLAACGVHVRVGDAVP